MIYSYSLGEYSREPPEKKKKRELLKSFQCQQCGVIVDFDKFAKTNCRIRKKFCNSCSYQRKLKYSRDKKREEKAIRLAKNMPS
jgi:hypothetical protein